MPRGTHVGAWRRLARAGGATLLVVATGAFAGGARATGATGDVCTYPYQVPRNTWEPLPTPAGAISVAQLDQDPCQLVASAAAPFDVPRVWHSSDAGRHWEPDPSAPPMSHIVTERLTKLARHEWLGGILATGPLTPAGVTIVDAVQQVYTSTDGGRSYDASVLGTAGGGVPLRANLLSAATAVQYANGAPQPVYYVVAAVARPTGVAAVPSTAVDRELLSSSDGGHSFTPVGTGSAFAPTVLDVNQQDQNEIWVNNIGSGVPGGAWKTTDGGTTWAPACCSSAAVNDIAFGPGDKGRSAVYLATSQGLLVSQDDGADWATITTSPVASVRAVPDAPGVVVLVTSAGEAQVWRSTVNKAVALPGLPNDCAPKDLRRDAIVPPTYLVTCASGVTYRLLLDGYGVGGSWSSDYTPFGVTPPPTVVTGIQLPQLASWTLPAANKDSGAIAFDGTDLYYDDAFGDIRRIRADDGRYDGQLGLPAYVHAAGLTVDLKRNRLLLASSDLYAYSLARHRLNNLGHAPYEVPTFDASTGGLAWVPTQEDVLNRAPIGGGWDVQTVCTGIPQYGATGGSGLDDSPATFVADGDGGGYIQSEDDITLYRIDAKCHLLGPLYRHRQFSEAGYENDAMACDMQTFFPQAAIWIRDSAPGTVTAYAVPYGYCPMPSRIVVTAPATVPSGSVSSLCAVLTNETSGRPAANRGVTMNVRGVSLGNVRTAGNGQACFTYAAPTVAGGHRLPLHVEAEFAGDASLYPSSTVAQLAVVAPATVLTHVATLPLRAPLPPNIEPPPVNPPNVPAPGTGPATNVSQAQQGQAQSQSQPGTQGVLVAQQEKQPQLALATVANQLETNVAGQNAMSAPASPMRPASGWPAPLLVGVGAACMVIVSALARGVAQVSPQRRRPTAPSRNRRVR